MIYVYIILFTMHVVLLIHYTIDGIIFKENSSYSELYNLIAKRLDVNLIGKTTKIENKIEKNNKSMKKMYA